ncbi:acetyl-CoA synthetase-like protein [Backusella circina FSU 941]|nr:acetyl-CoA synthetase-like protein [Backusella circina FSU 941]
MNIELDLLSYTLLTSIIGTWTWKRMHRPKSADMHPLLLNAQSDVSRLRHVGESAVYRSRMSPIGSPLCYTFDQTTQTLADFYRAGAIERDVSATMLVYRGLRYFGHLVPQSEDESSFVGIYGKNSLTCHCNGLVTVPMSSNAPSSHVVHTIQQSQLRLLVIDSELLDEVIGSLKGTSLKYIVCIGESVKKPSCSSLEIITFEDLETIGKSHSYEPIQLSPNDMASIYFKNVWSYSLALPPGKRFTKKDCLMLNLPLGDLFGYIMVAVITKTGGSIVFTDNHSDDSIFALAQQIKPTSIVSSPLFYRKLKQHVYNQYGNSFLFKRGYKVKKEEYMNQGVLVSDCKYDVLVFNRIRQALFGGNLRVIYIDNDDAADATLAEFLRIVMSAQVLQAFNTTETASAMTLSVFYDYSPDPHFRGAPLPCNEMKVVDVPELCLYSSDLPNPRGELWIRGNNVFKGYYGDEEATDEALDIDGWFMTGLMCEILPNGTLKSLGKRSCY